MQPLYLPKQTIRFMPQGKTPLDRRIAAVKLLTILSQYTHDGYVLLLCRAEDVLYVLDMVKELGGNESRLIIARRNTHLPDLLAEYKVHVAALRAVALFDHFRPKDNGFMVEPYYHVPRQVRRMFYALGDMKHVSVYAAWPIDSPDQ